jgi:hypothetical protein
LFVRFVSVTRDDKLKALIVSTTLFATIIVCLTFGIACGYAAVTGILRAFGHRSPKPAAASLKALQVGSGD